MASVTFDPKKPFSVEGEDSKPRFNPSAPFEIEDTPEPGFLDKAATLGGEFIGSAGSNLYKAGEGLFRSAANTDKTQAERFSGEIDKMEADRAQVQADIDAGKNIEDNKLKLGYLEGNIEERKKDRDAMLASSYNQPEQTIARRNAVNATANTLQDVADTASTMYGQKPGDQSLPAQIGRGAGAVAAVLPTMAIPGVGPVAAFGQMSASTYADVFDQSLKNQQAQGGATQEEMLRNAHQEASQAVEKSIPQLAAYAAGGKIAGGIVEKFLPEAAPLAKAAAGFGASAAANTIVSGATRAAEGQPILPTAEQATQDILFGASHGAGEYIKAKEAAANPEVPATPSEIRPIVEQANKEAKVIKLDETAQNAAENFAPQTAATVAKIAEKVDATPASLASPELAKELDEHEQTTKEDYTGPLEDQIKAGQPISVKDIQDNFILLPGDYVRDGDQYVHKPVEFPALADESFAPPDPVEAPQEAPVAEEPSPTESVTEPESIAEQAPEEEFQPHNFKASDASDVIQTVSGDKPIALVSSKLPINQQAIKVAKQRGLEVVEDGESSIIFPKENRAQFEKLQELRGWAKDNLATATPKQVYQYHKNVGQIFGYPENEVEQFARREEDRRKQESQSIVQPENAQEAPTEEAKQPEQNTQPVESPAPSEPASTEGAVATEAEPATVKKLQDIEKSIPLTEEQKARKTEAESEGFNVGPVFHGTNSEFSKFDLSNFGSTDPGWFGKGIYFSSDPKFAKEFGKNVKEDYVQVKNPLFVERHPENSPMTDLMNALEDQADKGIRKYIYDKEFGTGVYEQILGGKTREEINKIESKRSDGDMPLITKAVNDILERDGFDALVKTRPGKNEGFREVMVLDPKQVKSSNEPATPQSEPEAPSGVVEPTPQAEEEKSGIIRGFHGSRKPLATWDVDKGGGLINLTFKPNPAGVSPKEQATRYAEGGGGGRDRLSYEKDILNTDDGDYKWSDADKGFNLIDGNKGAQKTLSLEEAKRLSDKQEASLKPSESHVGEYDVKTQNPLDTTTPEGAKKFLKILDDLNTDGLKAQQLKVLIGIKAALRRGNSFWEHTKYEGKDKLFKDAVVPALKAAGHDSLIYGDESHATLAAFDFDQLNPINAPKAQAEVPSEQAPPTVEQAEPTAPAAGQRVRLGKQLTPFEIVTEHPQTEADKANGEQYFDLKNTKTGEIQRNVLSTDFTPIKPKATPNARPTKATKQEPPKTVPGEKSDNLPISSLETGKGNEPPKEDLAKRSEDLRKRASKVLGDHKDQVDYDQLAKFEDQEVEYTFETHPDGSRVDVKPNGRIVVNLDPEDFHTESSKEKAQAVQEEETAHTAQALEWRRQWVEADRPGDLSGFIRNKTRVLHDDLIASYNAAPAKDKPALEKMLVAAYNIYFHGFGEKTEAVTNIGELIDRINEADVTKAKGAPTSAAYIMELTRMLHQQRARGRITESTFQSFIRTIRDWVKRSFAHFQDGVYHFGEGGILKKTLAEKFRQDFEKVLNGQKPSERFIAREFDRPSINKLDDIFAKKDRDILEGAEDLVKRFAPLTEEQQKLVNDNQRLAYSIANDYRNIPKSEYDDLKHEAILSLSEAARAYDPSKGTFGQVAATYIRNKLRTLFRNQSRRAVRDAGSLNEITPTGTEKIENIQAPAEKPQGEPDAIAKIQKVVAALPERERRILEMKAEGMSLREISEGLKPDYELSYERVNQLYKKTAADLQSQLRGEGINSREDVFPDQSERTQYLPERVSPEDETRMVEQATEDKLAGKNYTEQTKFNADGEEEGIQAAAKQDEDISFGGKSEKDFRNSIKGLEKGSYKKGDGLESLKEKGARVTEFAKEMYDSVPEKAKNAVKSVFRDPKLSNFKKVLLKWDGNRQKASVEIRRTIEDIDRIAPSKRDQVAITNFLQADGDKTQLAAWRDGSKSSSLRRGYQDAIDLSPEHMKLANSIKTLLENKFEDGLKAGVFQSRDSFRKNYVTQFWKMVDPDTTTQGMYGKLARTFKYAKERKFDNFFEGEQAGYTPTSKKISDLLGVYLNEMDKTLTTRELIKDLVRTKNENGEALAIPLGGMKSGGSTGEPNYVRPLQSNEDIPYKPLAHNALQNWKWIGKEGDKNIMMQGQLGLHPDIFGHLKNVLGYSAITDWYNKPSEGLTGNIIKGTAKFLDKGNRAFANSMLGGLSTFHMVHEMKRAGGWRINPLKVEKINPDDPKFQDATKHGLGLAGDNEAMSHFIEGFGGQWNVWHTIPPLGRLVDTYTGWLFHEYIPALKLKTYNNVLERNLALYKPELDSGKMTPDDVKYVTAQLVNARYGHLNRVDIGRDPTIQHFLRIALLAPDFLESNARNYALAAKGVTSKSGREATIGFLVTAAFIAAIAKTINTVVDDKHDPHFEEPFGVVHNGKVFTMRNEAEDLYRALFQTRSYVSGRLSPGVSTAMEALSGRNYRGEKLSGSDIARDIATKWIPITLRAIPQVARTIDPNKTISAWDQFLSSQGIQVARRSPINEGYKLAGEFEKAQGKKEDTGTYPVSPYLALRYAIEDNDPEKAQSELVKLAESTGNPPEKIYEGFKRSLLRLWTGSKESEQAFKKSLKGEDLDLFKNAETARSKVWTDFNKVYNSSNKQLREVYQKGKQKKTEGLASK